MIRAAFAIPGDIDTPTGGYAYDREVLARLAGCGVAARHLPLPDGFPFPDVAALEATGEALAAVPADEVLLIDGLAFGALPSDLVRRIAAAIVVLVHHPLGYETGLDAATASDLVRRETAALAHARRVIVTSATTGRLLQARFAVPSEAITVAVPGTPKADAAVGSRDPARPSLLAVGAVSRRKGYGILVEALAMLKAWPWSATIAGTMERSPDVAAELLAQIESEGLSDRIRLAGGVERRVLGGLYLGADVFLMPSLYEGYGMVLAEAMAHGLPIVCTTGGAAAETVPDGAAVKVPPGDARAFAEALAPLLDRPAYRAALAGVSRAAGQRLPDWPDTAAIVARVLIAAAREDRR